MNREFQLALQGGQLAYRVRAVGEGERAGPWSRAFEVGKATR